MRRNFPKFAFFILFYLSYAGLYLARLNMSVASPALIAGGHLTEVQLGFIGSAFSVIYACSRFASGVMGDRLAPWIMITLGLAGTGAANILIGTLPPYVLILALWCINAFAQSMLWSSILRSMAGIYEKDEVGRKSSVLTSCIAVGQVASILFNSRLISAFGVRAAFLVPGVFSVMMGLIALYMLPGAPYEAAAKAQPLPFRAFIKNKEIRGIILPTVFHGVLKENISLWMAVYFLSRFAMDIEHSTVYMLLIPLVGLAARLVYPVCYRLSGRREGLMSIVCFALCAVLSALLGAGPAKPIIAAVGLSLTFAFISIINTTVSSTFPLRFAKDNMVASVSGLLDLVTYIGASVSSALYGFWVAEGKFSSMFISWAVLCVVSALLMFTQKPLKKQM